MYLFGHLTCLLFILHVNCNAIYYCSSFNLLKDFRHYVSHGLNDIAATNKRTMGIELNMTMI